MQTAWRLTQIQAVWHSNNTFTKK